MSVWLVPLLEDPFRARSLNFPRGSPEELPGQGVSYEQYLPIFVAARNLRRLILVQQASRRLPIQEGLMIWFAVGGVEPLSGVRQRSAFERVGGIWDATVSGWC